MQSEQSRPVMAVLAMHVMATCWSHHRCCTPVHADADSAVLHEQATLCGVWASLQWTAADVRVVTMGSPAVGNMQFAQVSFPPSRSTSISTPLHCQTPGTMAT